MKKLLLASLAVIALGGSCNTQCLSLWPFGSEDTTTYDITELKNYLTTSKAHIHYTDKHCTIHVIVPVIAPDNPTIWLKSLPYVTNIKVLATTTDYSPDCLPLIPWVNYHLLITLKPRAFEDLIKFYDSLIA